MNDFRDPRLHHLRLDFKRESVMPNKIDFASNQAAFKAAIEEIIKYNCFINEYNYLQNIA